MPQDFDPSAPVILQTEDKARGEFVFTFTAGQVLSAYWSDEGPHRSLYYADEAAEEIVTRADAMAALSGIFEPFTFYDEDGERYRVTVDHIARGARNLPPHGESQTGGPFYVISGRNGGSYPDNTEGPFSTFDKAQAEASSREEPGRWALILEPALTP